MSQTSWPDIEAYVPDEVDKQAWVDYQANVFDVLGGLDMLGGRNLQKKRNTVWHVAWAECTPGARVIDALDRSDTVGKSTYYHKDKDWYHNDVFKNVLDEVIKLTRSYIEGKQGRLLAVRQQQITEYGYGLSVDMFEKAKTMLEFPLHETVVEEETKTLEDGRTIVVRKTIVAPANWNFGDAARIAKTASDVGRIALGMNTKQERRELDLTKLTDEELNALLDE